MSCGVLLPVTDVEFLRHFPIHGFRLRSGGNLARIERALSNAASEEQMRAELSNAALGVLAQQPSRPLLPDAIAGRVKHLANLVATARSAVPRDRSGTVTHVPEPEIGTRVAKQLKKVAMGVAMARGIGEVDADVYRVVVRVALDRGTTEFVGRYARLISFLTYCALCDILSAWAEDQDHRIWRTSSGRRLPKAA